jgi:hypothetical protein
MPLMKVQKVNKSVLRKQTGFIARVFFSFFKMLLFIASLSEHSFVVHIFWVGYLSQKRFVRKPQVLSSKSDSLVKLGKKGQLNCSLLKTIKTYFSTVNQSQSSYFHIF